MQKNDDFKDLIRVNFEEELEKTFTLTDVEKEFSKLDEKELELVLGGSSYLSVNNKPLNTLKAVKKCGLIN